MSAKDDEVKGGWDGKIGAEGQAEAAGRLATC